MDLKVYGGWPIRLKQLSVNLRMDNRGPTEIEAFDLKQAGIAFDKVLEEAQHMKDQLKAHEELAHMVSDFGSVVGEGAQYVPTKDVDTPGIAHELRYDPLAREDKSVWPHNPDTWPKGGLGTIGAPEPVSSNHEFSHTSFMKLVERVGTLEKKLERLRGLGPGLVY
jgi:hypothetical protein